MTAPATIAALPGDLVVRANLTRRKPWLPRTVVAIALSCSPVAAQQAGKGESAYERLLREVGLWSLLEVSPPEAKLPGTQDAWHIFGHNGSLVDWKVHGSEIVVQYRAPRADLGIPSGTILFRGRYQHRPDRRTAARRIEGTAYRFKTGCPPIGYAVIGRHNAAGAILSGRAPTIERGAGCVVTRYSARGPHSRLSFRFVYSVTHH